MSRGYGISGTPEFLGNDSDSFEDCWCSPPSDVDFYDFREYEEECNWYFAEGTESDWRADGLQEDGELVYLKDTYGPKLASVVFFSEVGTAGPMVCSTSGLPDGHGDGLIAPQDVPAVFGTNVCTTVGVDRDMAVFSLDSSDLICVMVHPMELPTLEGASVAHPDDTRMTVGWDGLGSEPWDNRTGFSVNRCCSAGWICADI